MTPEKITTLLRSLAVKRAEWNRADKRFRAEYEAHLKALLYEASYRMMTVEQVATALHLTTKQVRAAMRRYDLNPKHGRKFLSDKAGKALHQNAELLGLDPTEMDFTSPLAYLPMGEQMKAELAEAKTPETVTEIEEGRS